MNDDFSEDPMGKVFKSIGDEIGLGQARYLATNFILLELVRVLASREKDPRGFLAMMHESVSRRIDTQFPLDDPKAHASVIRGTVDRFYTNAGKKVVDS